MIDLKLGDVHELIKTLPDHSVNLVLADPPYGISAAKDKWDCPLNWDVLWPEINRVLAPKGAIALFGASKFTYKLVASNFDDFRYKYVWVKNLPSGHLNANRMPMRMYEEINIFYPKQCDYYPQRTSGHPTCGQIQGGVRQYGQRTYHSDMRVDWDGRDGTRCPKDVLFFDAVHNTKKVHPSEKPVPLLECLIKTYTVDGQTVLDFCMGSGSTGVAAVKNKRNFIGFELYKEYFDIAQDRISTEPISLIQELTTKGKADEQTTC